MDEHAVATSAVSCRGLRVSYGTVVAVDDATFEVRPGEVFGLLGPNGAGKTSLIRALTTILAPSAGTASVAGAPLTDPVAIRHRIGVLPESNGYPNRETAHGYLTFYGMLFGLDRPEAAKRASEQLERVGLGPRMHSRIRTFSRGMRQRLGLARALVTGPRVLFLDEPTLGLDPAGKDDMLAHLASIAREGETTVLLCSHLLDDVERICDRVAIMDAGRIISVGSVPEVSSDAGVGFTARVSVDPVDAPAVEAACTVAPFVASAGIVDGRKTEVTVRLLDSASSINELAGLLIDREIPFQRIELQGTRLNDAFLALTGRLEEAAS